MGVTREIRVIVGFRLTSEFYKKETFMETIQHNCNDIIKNYPVLQFFNYCPYCGAAMTKQVSKTKTTFKKGFSSKKFTVEEDVFDLYYHNEEDDDVYIVLEEKHTYDTNNSNTFIPLDDNLTEKKNKVRKSLDESGVGNYYGLFVLASTSY